MRLRTAKQVAEKYKGNLDYFRKPHFFRRLRGIAFALAVLGSLAAAIGFHYYGGRRAFFNTGPISANHAQFSNQCEVCHEGSRDDLAELLRLDKAAAHAREATFPSMDGLPAKARDAVASGAEKVAAHLDPERARQTAHALGRAVLGGTSLERMDAACAKCHEPQKLHLPQLAALSLRQVSRELPVVGAGACSSCHREHVGSGPMRMPGSESCAACHGSLDRLHESLTLVPTEGALASPRPEIRDFGDGQRRFIPPRAAPHQPVAFTSFAEGHPPFGYESKDARDPAAIRYNHARHEQADIPLVDGRRLDCVDCHKPGPDGAFVQRVNFEQHCVRCHSLHFDPDVPKLAIPHGDPEKVRAYLRSLTAQYVDYAVNQARITDRAQLQLYVTTQFNKLNARGLNTAEELERRVFLTGDPPENQARIGTKSNKGQFFPGCAKCHEVTATGLSRAPSIAPTNMADRWLTRGPFTHQPHAHMACVDCHAAAKSSAKTGDILLPPRTLCAECHRPLDSGKVQPISATEAMKPHELTEKQRREGGILSDCRACHRYHAPAEALIWAKPK